MDSSAGHGRMCSEYKGTIELLRGIPFFSVMPLDAVKVLACLCTRELYKAGDYIFAQGQIDQHAYLLLSGEAELLLLSGDTLETLRTFSEGDFIGGLSLVSKVTRLFSLRAKTDVTCIVLQRESFQKTLAQFPGCAAGILKVITFSVHQWENRLLHDYGKLCEECKAAVGVTLL